MRDQPSLAEPGGDTSLAPDAGKLALILAAEKLIADRGPAGVTIREITVEAKSRNSSAIYYHFGSREALIGAIFTYRRTTIDSVRQTFLAAHPDPDIRTLAEALVLPLETQLQPRPEGNYYLRFAERTMRNVVAADQVNASTGHSKGWEQALEGLRARMAQHWPTEIAEFRARLVETEVISGGAMIEALIEHQRLDPAVVPVYTAALIDAIVAIVDGHVSDLTERRRVNATIARPYN